MNREWLENGNFRSLPLAKSAENLYNSCAKSAGAKNVMQTKPLGMVRDIFIYQIITAVVALLGVFVVSRAHAISFAWGEGVMLLASAFLTWRVLSQRKKMQPAGLMLQFFAGELGKYVVIVVLTIALIKYTRVNELFYIMGLVVPQLFGAIAYGWKR
jgi:F0F1-type ATP synthase assembly protein I